MRAGTAPADMTRRGLRPTHSPAVRPANPTRPPRWCPCRASGRLQPERPRPLFRGRAADARPLADRLGGGAVDLRLGGLAPLVVGAVDDLLDHRLGRLAVGAVDDLL